MQAFDRDTRATTKASVNGQMSRSTGIGLGQHERMAPIFSECGAKKALPVFTTLVLTRRFRGSTSGSAWPFGA